MTRGSTGSKVGGLQEQLERTGQGAERSGRQGKELPGEDKSAGLSFTSPSSSHGLAAWHNTLVEVNLQPLDGTVGACSPSHTQTQPCRPRIRANEAGWLTDMSNRKTVGGGHSWQGGKTGMVMGDDP